MLLARKGYKVLLVDRASFPSDTLSTHQVQIKGGAALQRWGLLEQVLASNCPAVARQSFHLDRFNFQGKYFPLEGLAAVVCPRRILLDKILVDAAVKAGAELRQDLIVDDLISENGAITGIRGRIKPGHNGGDSQIEEHARLVIGADGKHSLVAKKVQAPEYKSQPALTCAYYTYWSGLAQEGGEIYNLQDAVVGIWPTNDGQAILYTAYPISEFPKIRGDIEGRFWKTMEMIPGLAERLENGRQADRFFGSADLPSFYRQPFGPGWALVGDAGMTMDPITGQGIGNAFRDAERLVQAIEDGFSGRLPLEKAMARYQKERDKETMPLYEFTARIASFETTSPEQEMLFAALEEKNEQVERFFGALTGSIPLQEFFSLPNLIRILGTKRMSRLILGKMNAGRSGKAVPGERTDALSNASPHRQGIGTDSHSS
jgi:flavin-dependent dehydrogenase